MIIDCHVHASKRGPEPDLARYTVRARRAGVNRSVLFAAAYQSDYEEGNARVADACRRYPERFLGFVYVHCRRDQGRIEQVVRRAVRAGMKGIKVHAADAPICEELCLAARRNRLPVLCDLMGRTRVLEMFGEGYADVPFILAHLGSFQDDVRAQRAVIQAMARYSNIHADTSGVRYFDMLVDAVRRAGPEKVLFGSDSPWLHPELELQKVKLLRLCPKELRLVVGGNLQRLIATESMSSRTSQRMILDRCQGD